MTKYASIKLIGLNIAHIPSVIQTEGIHTFYFIRREAFTSKPPHPMYKYFNLNYSTSKSHLTILKEITSSLVKIRDFKYFKNIALSAMILECNLNEV